MKAIRGDCREGPARPGAVRTRAFLKNVPTVPPADLFLVVPSNRIRPRDAPRLSCGIPCAQRRAVHVHRPVGIGSTFIATRHDPDVLHGASFEHAGRMDLSPQAALRDTYSAIPQDVQIPASAQPAVYVGRLRNLGRARRCREQRVEVGPPVCIRGHDSLSWQQYEGAGVKLSAKMPVSTLPTICSPSNDLNVERQRAQHRTACAPGFRGEPAWARHSTASETADYRSGRRSSYAQ